MVVSMKLKNNCIVNTFQELETRLYEAVDNSFLEAEDKSDSKRSAGSSDSKTTSPLPLEPIDVFGSLRGDGVIVVGDYHPLSQSKEALLTILENTSHPISLALSLGNDSSIDLDADQADWPFSIEPWRPLVECAKRRGFPVFSFGFKGNYKSSRSEKYHLWAERLRTFYRENPSLVLAIVGEKHAFVDDFPRVLSTYSIAHEVKSLFLADSRIYWSALNYGLDPFESAYSFEDASISVLPCHPLDKPNSYLAWLMGEEVFHFRALGSWASNSSYWSNRKEVFNRSFSKLIDYFELPNTRIEPPIVYQPEDIEELSSLYERLSFEESRALLKHIASNQSFSSARKNYLYLSRHSKCHLAEELTHVIHSFFSPPPIGDLEVEHRFYQEAVREALAFFGSKVIDPQRVCPSVEDLIEQMTSNDIHVSLSALLALNDHLREGGSILSAPKNLSDDASSMLAHFSGYRLGEELWKACIFGRISPIEVSKLLKIPMETLPEAQTIYEKLRALGQ